jgi:hypothetical protein
MHRLARGNIVRSASRAPEVCQSPNPTSKGWLCIRPRSISVTKVTHDPRPLALRPADQTAPATFASDPNSRATARSPSLAGQCSARSLALWLFGRSPRPSRRGAKPPSPQIPELAVDTRQPDDGSTHQRPHHPPWYATAQGNQHRKKAGEF